MNGPRWWLAAFVAGALFWAVIIALAWWLLVPASGGFSPQMPPKQYRGDTTLKVDFTRNASTLCSIVKAEPGSIACAGVGGDWAIMPNPCNWPDPYAKMMCHEIGHSQGWAADHPR